VDSATITRAALESLDDVGLDGLSMREVAARLGVRAGGLYYYLPDKAALLRSMANEICHEVVTDVDARPAGGGWAERAAVICAALRTVLRSHRDSARVLAAAPLIGSIGALALMERLIAVLEEGMPLDDACGAADTLMAYVTGSPQRREPKRNHWPIRIRLAYKLALRPGVQAARDRVNLLRRARA
jgi:TetR/AcrR family tetracycline transcriptional repressor